MDISIIILIAVVAVIALIVIVKMASKPKPIASQPPVTAAEPHHEGNGLSDEMAAAVEDVAGEFLGVEAHPGAPDDLTVIKGLGPKAAAQLHSLGISRYAQIAGLTESQAAALDARMGTFKGRIARDRWIEQARYLAAGDRAGFEATFGKLGG
jgi:predicted flap endonuclease-1-like 5' DNA nuclease